MTPPSKFTYQQLGSQLWALLAGRGGKSLGEVAKDGSVLWMAARPGAGVWIKDFKSRRAAALWLWQQYVDSLGHDALGSAAMTEHHETPYAALVRRAGLTSSMAARILGIDGRTSRRLISGKIPSHELTDRAIEVFVALGRKPEALASIPARAKAIALLWPLVEENERVLEIEARTGQPARRPLRNRALRQVIEREEARRAEHPDARPPGHGGSGLAQMLREADAALERSQAEALEGARKGLARARRAVSAPEPSPAA